MQSIQALREQRDAKAKELQELVGKPDWNAATDQPVYDAGIAAIDDFDAQIARIRKVNDLAASTMLNNSVLDATERHTREGGEDGKEALKLFAAWMRKGDRGISDEQWPLLRNTMSTTTPSEGGFTVQSEVATQVIDALKAFGGMRKVAHILRTATGAPLNFPTSDGTSEEGEIVDQNASATDLDLAFGTIPLPVYKYSSKVVTIPVELLMDTQIDIIAFLVARLRTRLGRVTNRHFTVGTGTNQPTGIVTSAGSGKVGTTGQTLAVTYDDLIDLQHSVDPAYREMGNTGFMFHDTTLKVIRKLKDAQNRPLFVPGYDTDLTGVTGGFPDTILGSPFTINQHMPVMAANAKSILYGDFSMYTIRDAMEIEVQRYYDSPYAKKGQVGFLAWLRSGGVLTDVGGAVKYYQNSAT